ncbi:MAG TPA: aspartyl/asparaginyl beta-hydroxylase domain-containing protein [Burkholderiales bacterium]|nr:aspartyl/asparaginyl beta-hydroxylase domain-containing protein [Burkholderiales bacterium]
MLAQAFAPRFPVPYEFPFSAAFVHFRGKVRHRFTRQLTDHSTLLAPVNALFDEGHIKAAAGCDDVGFNALFRTGWRRFHLKWYDTPLGAAQALCPKTVALVQSIPSLHGAMFAVLPPARTLVRASRTANVGGERVGLPNRIFGYAHQLRLAGKKIRARSRFACCALKYLVIGGLLYALLP